MIYHKSQIKQKINVFLHISHAQSTKPLHDGEKTTYSTQQTPRVGDESDQENARNIQHVLFHSIFLLCHPFLGFGLLPQSRMQQQMRASRGAAKTLNVPSDPDCTLPYPTLVDETARSLTFKRFLYDPTPMTDRIPQSSRRALFFCSFPSRALNMIWAPAVVG